MRHCISALVQNHSGVLARVSGLFSARAYNIESLAVGTTLDPEYSRMTIVVSGDDQVLDQVVKQLAKLVEVVKVDDLKPETSVLRELALVKVKAEGAHRLEMFEISNVFRAKVVDVSAGSLSVEVTGTHDKVEAFLELAKPHGILEIVRTGVAGLSRGTGTLS
ncbi:MAG TPA: acetolactate synthase small subunit [bacterium]|jgi:acetolactate synthase-1/3 small subunit|nr:acetolactate synthase small subunit [bacterium]